MPSWNAAQYLRFAGERTQPCRDLVTRIALESPRRIIDLGCGPGNSTEVLAARWPKSEITGLDSSAGMIEKARADYPNHCWFVENIERWVESAEASYDLVFSNAALQWVPDHPGLFPKLMERVAPGGALAVQMPGNWDSTAHNIMRNVAARFPETEKAREWFTHSTGFYFDAVAPLASRVDLWATEYIHVMDSSDAIVEWYKGTGMRPFLDALTGDAQRELFLATYREAIREAYPARACGKVLFPFRRIFFIAYSPHHLVR